MFSQPLLGVRPFSNKSDVIPFTKVSPDNEQERVMLNDETEGGDDNKAMRDDPNYTRTRCRHENDVGQTIPSKHPVLSRLVGTFHKKNNAIFSALQNK